MRSEVQGRPDLSLLEDNFESGHLFYEPQHFGNTLGSADVKFRETES